MSEDQNLVPEDEAVDSVPEWVPEKFRNNPEKFGEAYTNLEREYHQSRQQVKAIEENYTALAAQFNETAAQQSQTDPTDAQAQLYAMYENDPVATMAYIAQQQAQQIAQQTMQQITQNQDRVSPELALDIAERRISAKYEDWEQYREKIGQHIASDPFVQNNDIWTNPALTTQAIERAYKTVKAEAVLENPEQYGQQQADLARRMKLQAQSAVGAGGRPDPVAADKAEWDRIMGAAPKRYYE